MSEAYLCIGGPLDGQMRSFEEAKSEFKVVENLKVSLVCDTHITLDQALPLFKEHTYRQQCWRQEDPEIEHRIWLHSTVDPNDIMGMLLEGYRQPRKED